MLRWFSALRYGRGGDIKRLKLAKSGWNIPITTWSRYVAGSIAPGGSTHVLIDSGASHTVISDRVLKAEGPPIDVTTANGVIHVNQREVLLTIAESLEVKSKALVESHAMPQDVDILLGQDVLRQFRSVVFDYENQTVEFRR